jgi:protein-S-isoprenylcysteine O-methyltransferase Ste14
VETSPALPIYPLFVYSFLDESYIEVGILNLSQMSQLDKPRLSVTKQAVIGLAALAILLWVVLFVPAWTLNYWQAWIFWLVFVSCILAISAYFIKKDLTLIAGRLKVGAAAEQDHIQQLTQVVISVFFILLLLIPSLDHHFQWSTLPSTLSLAGDAFVGLGLLTIFLVFKENTYTSVLVEVKEGQKVISTGPYSKVRHPMYSGALLMLLFMPLALGSYWGLLAFPPILASIAVRILAEEKFLAKDLQGYSEYCQKVRYRLVPYVW